MARRLAAAAGVAPLVTALAVVGGASVATAAASGGITAPGGTVSQKGPIRIAATVKNEVRLGLYVKGKKVAQGGCGLIPLCTKTISGSYNPGNARNGSYTVTLKGEVTGRTFDRKTFALRRPPATPTGVGASLKGKDRVALRWSKGSEPDLTSYKVVTSTGRSVGSVSAGSCSSTCSATVGAPSSAAGKRMGFGVVARRSSGSGGGTISSGRSGMAFVKFPATPKPSDPGRPPKDPRTGQPDLPDPEGKDGSSPLQLPPAEQSSNPAPIPEPRLPDAGGQGEGAQQASPASSTGGMPVTWAFSIAIGLILLLIAAHAGTWARRRFALAAEGTAATSKGRGRLVRRRVRRKRRPDKPDPGPDVADRSTQSPEVPISGSGTTDEWEAEAAAAASALPPIPQTGELFTDTGEVVSPEKSGYSRYLGRHRD